MEGRQKVTKEVLSEEARFILANVLAEGRYGRQNRFADIKRICEGSVSIPFGEYIAFLEAAGYLTHDRGRDTLDVTPEGERVVTGERVAELVERAVAHFKGGRNKAAGRQAMAAGSAEPAAFKNVASQVGVSQGGAVIAPGPNVVRAERPEGARYEKIAPIGSGGIGTVYRAKQIQLEREVALKEIRDLFGFFGEEQRREIVRRFGEVVREASQLSHPNIVAIHDAAIDREHPYVVTELMPQGSVRRLIADAEEIPVALVVKYLLQVLHALRAAHAKGVVHRSLKPENLLIDAHGNVKVSDFGFARIVERDQAIIRQVYVGMGTVAYMAPELFTDPLGSGPQTDIYALGIIFYEMLTRKLPGRRSPMPSQINSELPKGIDDIFDRMTRDERDERYHSVEDILADFDHIAGMERVVGGSYMVLFGENPISSLKFRTPTPVSQDAGARTTVPTDSSGGASTGEASVGVAGGNGEAGLAARRPSLGRRPYSYQQRHKDKGDS